MKKLTDCGLIRRLRVFDTAERDVAVDNYYFFFKKCLGVPGWRDNFQNDMTRHDYFNG